MRVVYSTDECGAPLQKVGSLQFVDEYYTDDVPEGKPTSLDIDLISSLLDSSNWELCNADSLYDQLCSSKSCECSAPHCSETSADQMSDGESGENSSDTADSSILAFAGGNGNLDMECISPCAKRPRVTDVCFDSPVSSPSPSGSCSPVCTPRSSLDSPGSDVSAFTPAGVGSSPLSRDTSSIFTDAKPTTYERHIPQPVLAARPRPEATPTVELPGSSLPLSGSSLEAEVISFVREPTPLQQGTDVSVQACWGVNSQTYKNIFNALALSDCFANGSKDSEAARHRFIEDRLLPAVQLAGPRGCSLLHVVNSMQRDARSHGDAAEAEICGKLAAQISAHETSKRGRAVMASQESPSAHFRVVAKGTGVICRRKGGLPAGTFVGMFSGETYTPWRWFEKQDTVRRKHGSRSAAALHSAAPLERPKHADSQGYNVAFVDASEDASIGSKVAHGCTPNCKAVTVSINGKLSLGIFTTHHIPEGQELSRDHAFVTELEQEFRSSTCLCSSSCCRGFSLFYVNSKSFHEILSKHHTFLDRTAMILAACTDELTPADELRLSRHGVSSSILTDTDLNNGQPMQWCKKWASLLIQYIELEAESLPTALVQRHGYSETLARAEADIISRNRLQNLACTLDKAKYFLTKQPADCRVAPLRMLTETEVVNHLWTGPSSIARRFASLCVESLSHSAAAGPVVQRISELLQRRPKTKLESQQLLRELAAVMGAVGPSHHAAQDCALLYASTEHFFEPAKYGAVSTSPSEAGATPHSKKANGGKKGSEGQAASKKYRPGFLWGQLSAWFKQTVRDPSASLSADRRGTVSLPDPECCFGKEVSAGKYGPKDRAALVNHIDSTPSVMWPLQTIWSFKNPSKVYGSPMLDVAIRRARGDPSTRRAFDSLLAELRNSM